MFLLMLILAALAALLPAAEAGLKASSFAGRSGTYSTPSVRYSSYTSRTSRVRCSSKATAVSYSRSANGFATAMADAFEYGCSKQLPWDFGIMVDIMSDHDDAYAFAYSRASADVGCVSQGNAYGCATARANAKAWARAVLRVWAGAWATAINRCDCKGKTNEAIVSDWGSAYEFERLVAKVEAEANARVCVSGYDAAFASADSKCVHNIYAVGFARAFALALIEGKCYRPLDEGLDARAVIDAKATIQRWDYVDC